MTESPIHTPSSVHPTSSPRDHSPIITGVSALSTPTAESVDADAAITPSSSRQEVPRPARAAVESLGTTDNDDNEEEENVTWQTNREAAQMRMPPTREPLSSSTATAPVHITAADYADRRRLLNHITYLSTQLQRAQLQVEDLTRTMCVLRSLCVTDDKTDAESGDTTTAAATAPSSSAAAVLAEVTDNATTAAVLAAHDEAEVHAALQAALAVFDPVIAQTQIYRLDDALAQMGLLREAELAQLHSTSTALQEHRTLTAQLSEEVTHLRSRAATLEQQKQQAESQLTAATLELQRLRHEELRLNQRVAGLQELASDGTWMSNVRVVNAMSSGAASLPASPSLPLSNQLARLVEEERLARQELLLELFWDPMLIAFDAGLTWVADSAALRVDGGPPAPAANAVSPRHAASEEEERRRYDGGVSVPPPSDADLLLLRRQQEEVTELRARVQLLQDRSRIAALEKERLQFLYENEVRRSERMAQDHVAQLQQAYDEVVKDRQCMMRKLKGEVEEQLRLAFEDGRAYERNTGVRSRSRPPSKVLRSGNAVT
jgi:hypothetical protein